MSEKKVKSKTSMLHKAVVLLVCLLVVNGIHYMELANARGQQADLLDQEHRLNERKASILNSIRNGQMAQSMKNELAGWSAAPSPVDYLKLLEFTPENMTFKSFRCDFSPGTQSLPAEQRGYWFKEALHFSGSASMEFTGSIKEIDAEAYGEYMAEAIRLHGDHFETLETPLTEEELQEMVPSFSIRAMIPDYTAWENHE